MRPLRGSRCGLHRVNGLLLDTTLEGDTDGVAVAGAWGGDSGRVVAPLRNATTGGDNCFPRVAILSAPHITRLSSTILLHGDAIALPSFIPAHGNTRLATIITPRALRSRVTTLRRVG
jgi:hypothetical protein